MSQISALGYIGVTSRLAEDWVGLASEKIGMQLSEKTRRRHVFRMDDRKQRLFIDDGAEAGVTCYGWEVANAAAADQLGADLERHGVAVSPMTRDLCEERHVASGIQFQDPAGNRLEAFWGPEIASDPFVPGRNMSGFRTGPLGLGHAVLMVPDMVAARAFYENVLGFRLSDFVLEPFELYFYHVNPRHHTVALFQSDKRQVHHLMVEMMSLDDVGQTYDLGLLDEDQIGVTLGRHTNDHMTSFYWNTPSKFMLECGWGGLSVDPENHQATECNQGPSLWGHERKWLPPEGREKARVMRLSAAAQGVRAPVHVIPGNHTVDAACPWYAQLKAGL